MRTSSRKQLPIQGSRRYKRHQELIDIAPIKNVAITGKCQESSPCMITADILYLACVAVVLIRNADAKIML